MQEKRCNGTIPTLPRHTAGCIRSVNGIDNRYGHGP